MSGLANPANSIGRRSASISSRLGSLSSTSVPQAPPIQGGIGGISPKIGGLSSPAPATPWSASRAGALTSAIQGNAHAGGPGSVASPATAAPPPPSVSAAGKVGMIGRAGGMARGLASRVGPLAVATAISAASGNPDEGFMHLGGEGSFREGARRGLTSLGHAISGEPQPGDMTAGDLGNSIMQHTWAGDILGGIGQMGKTIGDFVSRPQQSTQEFGRGLSVLGDRMFGGGTPGPPVQAPAVATGQPGISSELAQHMHNTMGADELNSLYSQLGIGGDNSSAQAHASLAAAAPKSPDAPSVLGTPQVQPNSGPQGMDWGLPGHNSDPAIQAMREAMQNANWRNNPEGVATLGHALANYRGAMGNNRAQEIGAQAHMLGAQADMQRAVSPLGGYMNPVGLQMLDAQAGGTGNVIGAAQAGGIGLGPRGAISPQGMPAYTGLRHPEFSGLIGNKDASLDQFRDMYNQTKSRFAVGDAQLSELQNYLSQALRSRFAPEDMDAASRPDFLHWLGSWFGGGDGGAGRTGQFLSEIGVR